MATASWPRGQANVREGGDEVNWRCRSARRRCSLVPVYFHKKTGAQAARIPDFQEAARNPVFFMGNQMTFQMLVTNFFRL